MKKLTLAASLAAALVAGTAMAEGNHIELGAGYALLNGAQLDAAYYVNDYVSVRASLANGQSASKTETSTSGTYSGDLNLKGNTLGVGIHPFGGTFYVQGGYYFSDSYVKAHTNNFTSGALVGQTADAKVSLQSGPMLTLGWASGNKSGLSFNSEIGVISTAAKMDYLNVSNSAGQEAAVAAEKAKLEKDLANVSLIPVVHIGLSYAF